MFLKGMSLSESVAILHFITDHNPNRKNLDDIGCLDFAPISTTEKAAQIDLIETELVRRGIPLGMLPSHNKETLKRRLKDEWTYNEMCMRVKYWDRKGLTLYESWQAATCTLHLEARVGEKILQCILRRGLSKAQVIYGTTSLRAAQDRLVVEVEEVVRGQIFNTTKRHGYWTFPTTNNKDGTGGLELGKVSFTKGRARKVMNEIDLVLEICYADDPATCETLKSALRSYRSGVEILRKRTNYTPEELESFQKHIDDWYSVWMEQFGVVGCTNYTHMLSAGHIREEMGWYGCLYRYSQEGLEAVNALIKSFFFRRTQRGGGKGIGTSNRLEPHARWQQRKMYWLLLMVEPGFVEDGDLAGESQTVASSDGSDEEEEEFADDDSMYGNQEEQHNEECSEYGDL